MRSIVRFIAPEINNKFSSAIWYYTAEKVSPHSNPKFLIMEEIRETLMKKIQ